MITSARPATNADLDVVLALVHEGRAAISDQRGGLMWLRREAPAEPVAETYSMVLDEAGSSCCLLATIDDTPLGFMLLVLITDTTATVADIAELWVTPEARGVSLGEELMLAATEWGRANGASGLSGRALPGDRATKNYFETYGLVARSIEVYQTIDGP